MIFIKMKTMDDYHDFYSKTNVLLLPDVFETFIDMHLEYYGLNYFSSTGLIWYAMLKMTGVKSELISYIDMYLFVEKGMRWGILTLLKDIVKPIINTWNHMMIVNQINMWHNWMQIICLAGQWVNIFLTMDLNG